MWVARVLKRPVDKSDAPSLSRAEFKKLDSELNRLFVTRARHLRLVATIKSTLNPIRLTFLAPQAGLPEPEVSRASHPKARDGTQQVAQYLQNP